ncbi:protein translocase subunit SecDF [uncultured Porphyromonas sp.]|uniref:protein translocase subunit SecDF n=1 Tax=uncultured Porphyromonas sp. TaxID=159274 RepID=UPI00261D847C|nr:protein translocase subunit SecDF [uncultured Porphyromonas sp.]
MQNKGFVILFAALLTIICAFYISFTPVVRHYDQKALAMTAAGEDGKAYLDSMANEKVWFGYTLKKARNQQIGLGLDLKGGMNVVLKVNGRDLLRNLSGHNQSPAFIEAIDRAAKEGANDFVGTFVEAYKELEPSGSLAVIFSNGPLRDVISPKSSDQEVIKELQEKYSSAIDAAINVLKTRIDRFGVVAPNVQRIEGQGRILVELPGVTEPQRVRELLQRSANLQFWRTYTYDEIASDLVDANNRLTAMANGKDLTPADTTTTAADSTAVQKPATGGVENVLFSKLNITNRGTIVGYARRADLDKIDEMLEEAQKQKMIREDLMLLWGNSPIKDPQTGKETDIYELYAIRGNRNALPDLGGEVVTSARSEVRNDLGQNRPVVTMTMNDEGARKWARLTGDNIGRNIAIVLDGVVYSAPNVNSEITGGRSEISGHFTVDETTDLANVLNSGRMEASVEIEQESVVGPTLGSESIQAGIISFAIAIILLMIYMCLAYGLIPGLIADGALILNSFFTLGVLASFHSVLTLSGIAGLVLTLGMAVDANILIFERIKEELRAGKSMTRAIQDGYGNAFSAIFDSNLTTVITGGVLYAFGTGPIRGFATTLIIGVIASFITAVFLTRIVVEALDKKGRMDKVTYTTFLTRNLLNNPSFKILENRNKGFIIFGSILVLGLIGSFVWGLNRGIEFSGGRNYIVAFEQPVSSAEVREALTKPLEEHVLVTSIGTEGNQVRISTNYGIGMAQESEDEELLVIGKVFEGVQKFLPQGTTQQQFVDNYVVSSQRVSPSMSKDISRQAIIAVVLSLIFMGLYILLRFRNWAFSLGAFASVATTTLLIVASYILLWQIMPFTMELDQNFIAALLAIIGYSINDVVVVFDRVRETLHNYPNREEKLVMNEALNSTLARTVQTSFSTFLVVFIIFLLGGASMRSFTFALLIGIVYGIFCTLFVASPIAYLVRSKQQRKKLAAAKK